MSRSSRTCRRAAEVRWTVETHPTLIYCRSRQTVLGSLVANTGGGFDLRAPDAAEAVAHINDLLRVDGGIVTPIYYWMCINTEIAPHHASSIRALLDAGADPEKRYFSLAATRCFGPRMGGHYRYAAASRRRLRRGLN